MVYLDYAANTPVDKEVLDLFYQVTLKYFANPNSQHKLGRQAKQLIDLATSNIANKLDVMFEEIIYTSGATESNNLALKGVCEQYKNYGKHIIISSLEHNSLVSSALALQEEGFEVEVLPVLESGIVDLKKLETIIRKDTIFVSVCAVDSELGIIQPIERISDIIKKNKHTYFHVDASQAIGKINLDLNNVDLATISPHKFYGMNGIGMLIKKKNILLKPMINGGISTTIFRSGTPNVAQIVALSKALELALNNQEQRNKHVSMLHDKIKIALQKYKKVHINNTEYSIPHIINFSIKGVNSIKIESMLEQKDIYVSTKTSCCPIDMPSKLVYAVTNDKSLASSSIRISISHLTSENDISEFLKKFDECYRELENNGEV